MTRQASTAGWACLRRQRHARGRHALVPVAPAHVEPIRLWRNAQLDVLRQPAPIAAARQQRYFAEHVWPQQPLAQPALVLLAFEQDGVAVGYGGLVHIAWEHRRAEVSFLLAPERTRAADAYAADFAAFLALLKEVAFDDLGLARLWTETYAIRDRHVAVLEASGFRPEGRLRGHVRIDGGPVDALLHGCLAADER